MLTVDEIVEKLKEIVGPRFVSTNPIDKINYQHSLAYGAFRSEERRVGKECRL